MMCYRDTWNIYFIICHVPQYSGPIYGNSSCNHISYIGAWVGIQRSTKTYSLDVLKRTTRSKCLHLHAHVNLEVLTGDRQGAAYMFTCMSLKPPHQYVNPFGFLSPAPEDAEMNSKLCQDCSVWFETFDQPMTFIPSVFITNIFLHFTLLVKHISSINIFQIFIHIYFT